MKNQRSDVHLVFLLSFGCGKRQINILFRDRYLLCVRGKASGAHFMHTQYTLWVTVCISCLNKSSFLSAYSGWREHSESSFILVIYFYHPGKTAAQESNAQFIHLYRLYVLLMTLLWYKFECHLVLILRRYTIEGIHKAKLQGYADLRKYVVI